LRPPYVTVTVESFTPRASGETFNSSSKLATRRERLPAELSIWAKAHSSGDSMQPLKNAERVMSVSTAREKDLLPWSDPRGANLSIG
jgi:hypothetical protein